MLLTTGVAQAQLKYQDLKNQGKALMDKHDYAGAIKKFNYAKQRAVDRRDHVGDKQLQGWLNECNSKVGRKRGSGNASTNQNNSSPQKPSAKIEDLRVYNGEVNGELGIRIKCSFYARNLKGRSVRVKSTFTLNNRTLSYEDGDPEYMEYVEYKEVCVSDIVEVETAEDYKSVELHIPYAAFRLTEFYEQEFKAHLEIFDDESSEADGDPPMAKADKKFVALPVSVFVDGNVNTKVIDAPAAGGFSIHNVRTGGEPYYFSGLPDWCHVENQTSSSFQIKVDKNFSTAMRSCDFSVHVGSVTSGGNKVRFYINQEGGSGDDGAQGAVATIYKPQIKHNVLGADGVKYMQVCPRVTVSGMRGQQLYLCLYFYQEDDQTPLVNKNGDPIMTYDEETAVYENCDWTEWCLRIANNDFLLAPNATSVVVFDLVLKDENGNVLAREDGFKVQAR